MTRFRNLHLLPLTALIAGTMACEDFDAVARQYYWLEYIAFGRALQRARTVHLPLLRHCRRILVVGDLMLDRYISGVVDRISPEAPVPVVRVQEERSALDRQGYWRAHHALDADDDLILDHRQHIRAVHRDEEHQPGAVQVFLHVAVASHTAQRGIRAGLSPALKGESLPAAIEAMRLPGNGQLLSSPIGR